MKKQRNIIVNCVYRKPGSDLVLFCESIEQLFTDVTLSKYIVVSGDCNIDILKLETHNETKRF